CTWAAPSRFMMHRIPLLDPRRTARRPIRLGVALVTWLVALAALAWAARLAILEGYLYEIPTNFVGDFTRTAELGAPEWFTGSGLFYGPIFIFEYRFLFAPGILGPSGFARLDFVLFGLAFACIWLALFRMRRPLLAIFVL